jgi:protein TonB
MPALAASTALVLLSGWALSAGLANGLVEKVNEVIQVNVLKDKIEKKEPPPPPPELKAPPPPFVPPPDIVIQTDAPPPQTAITTQSQIKVAPRLSAPFTIGKPHTCMQDYPPISVRLGEQGTTTLGFTINAEGRVENAHIITSSGSERLDNAALSCVGNWKYGPAKNDAGQAVPVPNQAKVLWNLK